MIPVPNYGQRGEFWSPIKVEIAPARHYFAVSNSYVMNKIRLLLFPFLRWRDDLNAPDLYLPLMAFITWIILSSISIATRTSFSPETFGKLASRGLSVVIVEVIFMKCYALDIPLLSVVAWSGYKFVGACVNVLAFLMFGTIIHHLFLAYNVVASAFVMCKHLGISLPFSCFCILMSQMVWTLVLAWSV